MEKEQIEQQICQSFEYDLAVKPENQKIYPFYVFTNFNTNRQYPVCYEPLCCSYCGISLNDSYGYYTAYIIFENSTVIRICCNAYHCKGRGNSHIYDFAEQKYGFTTPITFSPKFNESLEHLVVARCFLGSRSMWYALNKYVQNGITWAELNSLSNCSKSCGGSHVYSQSGSFLVWWQWNGTHLTTSSGSPLINLTKTGIIKIINEILAENRPQQQLSLF